MAQNYIASGNVIEVIAGAGGITSGAPVLAGPIVGIALTSAAQGATAEVKTCGAFRGLPKKTGEAWSQYAKVYWDSTNSYFTTTATNNTLAGVAYAAAQSVDATGSVLLTNGI